VIRFERPPCPPGFDAVVGGARTAVRAAVLAGASPVFDPVWGRREHEFKRRLAEAQRGKCGFCECKVLPTGRGDVEHFRPKAEVRELPSLTARGAQSRYESTPSGRERGAVVPGGGYWWLAYAWTNWLFACTSCNQDWKRNFFPIASAAPPITEGCEKGESALRLDPFGDDDPVGHLHFEADGQVSARDGSPKGDATIDVCGLALRPELIQARSRVARAAHKHLDAIFAAPTELAREPHFAALEAMGGDDEPHAGVVRSIAEERLGGTWAELFGG